MLLLLLLIPILGSLLCFITASDKIRRILLVSTALAFLATVLTIWANGIQYPANKWIAIDSLSLLFLFITAVLFAITSMYTVSYLSSHSNLQNRNKRFSRESVFTACLLLFLGMMALAIVSQHTGIFWMAIEATTLASAPLISYHSSARSLEASWKYLLICSVGIAIALIGNIALAVSASFDLNLEALPMTFAELTTHAENLQIVWLKGAFVFLLIGYGTKMGLVPMHTWLPDAHSESPSPVSALLSGALLNCAFLGILRTNAILIKAGVGTFSNDLLVFFGIISLIFAGWFIVQQADFKRMLAYSSIEHMGILALAAGAGAQTHFGSMLHAVNHSFTKGLLFLVAGNILSTFKTKSTKHITGIIQASPITGFLWIAGFMAICGVPPFGTFVSEFSILVGLGQQHHWYILAIMLLALGIIFVGMSRIIISMTYGSVSNDTIKQNNKEPLWAILPPILLFIMTIILGTWIPKPLTQLIEQASLILGAN